jgi:hypothetical protein
MPYPGEIGAARPVADVALRCGRNRDLDRHSRTMSTRVSIVPAVTVMHARRPSSEAVRRATASITRTKGTAPRVTRPPAKRTLAPCTRRGAPLRGAMNVSGGRRSVRCAQPASPVTRSNAIIRRTRSAHPAISALDGRRWAPVKTRAQFVGDTAGLRGDRAGVQQRSACSGHPHIGRHIHAGRGLAAAHR